MLLLRWLWPSKGFSGAAGSICKVFQPPTWVVAERTPPFLPTWVFSPMSLDYMSLKHGGSREVEEEEERGALLWLHMRKHIASLLPRLRNSC